MLTEQAATGGPKTVREVMDAFIRPVHQYTLENPQGTTYLRFLSNVQITHRALFRESIGVQWNVGYRSCLDYFRHYLSAIPAAILEQRMTLVSIYTTSVFSTKEAGSDTSTHTSRLWAPAFTVDNIVDTFVAMLECAPSEGTLQHVPSPTTATARKKKK
jgi:hypothetical protein